MPADAATGFSALSPEEMARFLTTLGWSLAMGLALMIWALLEKQDRDDQKKTGGVARKVDQVPPRQEGASGGEESDERPPDGPG